MRSWIPGTTTYPQDAILPAAGWPMATWVGIRSLSSPNVQFARKLEFLLYAVAATLLTVWWDYYGAQNLRSSRETTRNVQTLLALAGVSSKDGVNQGLDRLITRNLQPRQIIPTQEEELANALELIKGSLPNPLYVTYLPNLLDWPQVADPIERALQRNGIEVRTFPQTALSPRDTGLMFTMPDPANPPEYALKLRDALDIAGIRNIRFVQMAPSAAGYSFTIFVGPAPLK